MKKSLALALAAGMCCALTGVAAAQEYSSGPIAVEIADTPTVESSITITGGPVIGDLDVRINITHTYDGDLDIVLIAPGGTEYLHLATDVGGGGDNFISTVFDQDAATSISAGVAPAVAPFTGNFRPEGGIATFVASATLPLTGLTPLTNLDSLDGRDSNGTWTLRIDDDAAGDVGTLTEWALIVTAAGGPTNPVGSVTLSPTLGPVGTTVLATVSVLPGTNPPSTGIQVVADATAIDGGSGIVLLDNGVAPDAVSGDNIFSANLTVGANATTGNRTITFGISDAESRTTSTSSLFNVRPLPAANDLCESAEVLPTSGFPYATGGVFLSGNAAAIEQPMSCSTGGVTNAGYSVWYRFECPQTAAYRFTTSVNLATGNNLADTVIAVYESTDGTCGSLTQVACDDDGGVIANGGELQSDLTTDLTGGTVYYVQVAKWALAAPTDLNTTGLYVDQFIPRGACCQGTSCSILTEADCATAGGSYLGDNSQCTTSDGYSISDGMGAFEDISATGTNLGLTDDSNGNAPIGFTFNFYGTGFSNVFVGSNGFITFGAGSNVLANGAIPSAAVPNNAIYAMWDDLNPGAAGGVFYQTLGTPGVDQRFIVQWDQVPQFGIADSNTFQIVLFENGNAEIRYGAISAFTDADVTVGVENADGSTATSTPASGIFANTAKFVQYVPGTTNCSGPSCAWQADGCYSDYNNDGGIDGDDVIAFFGDWDGSVPCADMDGSGGVDGDDVISFFGAWDAGGVGFPGC